MTIEVRADTVIDATAEQVWSVLVDFADYAAWSDSLRIEGDPVVGARLRVRLSSGGRGRTIRPVVVAADAGVRFAWRGRLGLPGLVDGEHFFRLVPRPDGSTLLTHGEIYSGVVVALLRPLLPRGGQDASAYEAFSRRLKRRVESLFPAPSPRSPGAAPSAGAGRARSGASSTRAPRR